MSCLAILMWSGSPLPLASRLLLLLLLLVLRSQVLMVVAEAAATISPVQLWLDKRSVRIFVF